MRASWSGNLYCRHPYHILKNDNQPQKISRYMFKKKNCGNQKYGVCRWLISYESPGPKKEVKGIKRKSLSKNKMRGIISNQERRVKNLTDELIELKEQYEDLKKRHEEVVKTLMMK